MATMTADETLTQYLTKATEVTEYRDAEGNVLGYFAPASKASQLPAIKLAALFDPEELKRRSASTDPGSTLDQIKARWESLEKMS